MNDNLYTDHDKLYNSLFEQIRVLSVLYGDLKHKREVEKKNREESVEKIHKILDLIVNRKIGDAKAIINKYKGSNE